MTQKTQTDAPDLDDESVIAFLRANPDFLQRHPDLLEILTPPKKQLGDNVVDFQHYALSSLQRGMQSIKDQFEGIVSSARDNMSAQSQIHNAVLDMLNARNLDALMEVFTQDLPRYFDVDTVRIVIESDMAELYEPGYADASYSGISFVPRETVDLALGQGQVAALVADTQADPPFAYESIFADCSALIQSCAMLRLKLDSIERDGLLVFGVRDVGRFHQHQGVELLGFLADVVALRLNQCLQMDDSLVVV